MTPVLGLSPVLGPVPVLGPRDFSQADIPRAFRGSDDAAQARLKSLLKKEIYWRREGLGAIPELDFAYPNTLVKEVIAWILAVHDFLTYLFTILTISLERRWNHRWALQQPRRSEGGLILTIYMNNLRFIMIRDSLLRLSFLRVSSFQLWETQRTHWSLISQTPGISRSRMKAKTWLSGTMPSRRSRSL